MKIMLDIDISVIVFAVAQRRLESESLCNSEDLVYSIFGWNNSKELNFHNEKSS